MTEWVRLWHDMPTDPKWRSIARKSGQPLPAVIAVFVMLMTNASAHADDRGVLHGFEADDVAAALDMEPEHVEAIIGAMQGKVLDGDRLTGWEKRQPKREDGTAAARKQAWKERQVERRNAPERTGTHGNAPETDAETDAEAEVDKPPQRARKKRAAVGFELPEWVPAEQWANFLEMRKRIGHPITEPGKTLAVAELKKLADAGHPPGAVLDQSTLNSWRGLFVIGGRNGQRSGQGQDNPLGLGRTALAAIDVFGPPGMEGSDDSLASGEPR